LNFTSRHKHRYKSSPISPWAIALTLFIQFQVFEVSAQEATSTVVDTHIDAIRQLFQELDSSAQHCVEDHEADSCKSFATTLDESFIPAYLEHCAVIRGWREQLVADAESGAVVVDEDQGLASSLIGAEFSCGENSLARRTRFAVAAFQKWQQENSNTAQDPARYGQDGSSRTSPVSQALQNQQSRLSREIDQQWQRLELENIRQQLRKPINYGDYNYPR